MDIEPGVHTPKTGFFAIHHHRNLPRKGVRDCKFLRNRCAKHVETLNVVVVGWVESSLNRNATQNGGLEIADSDCAWKAHHMMRAHLAVVVAVVVGDLEQSPSSFSPAAQGQQIQDLSSSTTVKHSALHRLSRVRHTETSIEQNQQRYSAPLSWLWRSLREKIFFCMMHPPS